MISTVTMIGNYRIYTGWLVIGAAALLFVTTFVVHIVVMKKQNRRIKLAKLEAMPSTGQLYHAPLQQAADSAITEQLVADDATELLDSEGTELLNVAAQGDSKR